MNVRVCSAFLPTVSPFALMCDKQQHNNEYFTTTKSLNEAAADSVYIHFIEIFLNFFCSPTNVCWLNVRRAKIHK